MTGDDVRAAVERLTGIAHRTPVMTSTTLDERLGASVLLKCENFQRVGAFKFRGAYHALSRLSQEQLARGVCAYSSGNHAQAVALAARLFGTTATIVMPEDAPESKMAAVRGYHGQIRTYDRYSEDRVAICAELAARHGSTVVPPYDHPDIIAGQGTVAWELWEDHGPFDTIIAPMSGGGLMAGTAVISRALSRTTALIGVEPEEGDDHKQSLERGSRISIPTPHTVADGLANRTPGELTFQINRDLVSEVMTVSDDEIMEAMRFLFDRMKLVVEPSGAVAIAALLARSRPLGERVGVILSGGNIAAERFARLLAAD